MYFAHLPSLAFTRIFALALLMLFAGRETRAEPIKFAIFGLELIDTSLDGATYGTRTDEQARIALLSERLRKKLAEIDGFQVVDLEAMREKAKAVHLQGCGGCDMDFAAELGADISLTGTVQKVSNLILNLNLYVRDVKSRRELAAFSADFRGNTDESWVKALDWLIRNRLSEMKFDTRH